MLVSVANLVAYMGNMELTPEQEAEAEEILSGVQGELERYLNRPVEPVHVRESRPVDERGFIVFTVTPVIRINFIKDPEGNDITLPTAVSLPPIAAVPGVDRTWDRVGAGEVSGAPYEFFVGYGNWFMPPDSLGWVIGDPLSPYGRSFYCDYVGGYNGESDDDMVNAIKRVAARECERQFDDTLTIRGASQDAALQSDSRNKGWTTDELKEFSRVRRRIAT